MNGLDERINQCFYSQFFQLYIFIYTLTTTTITVITVTLLHILNRGIIIIGI